MYKLLITAWLSQSIDRGTNGNSISTSINMQILEFNDYDDANAAFIKLTSNTNITRIVEKLY